MVEKIAPNLSKLKLLVCLDAEAAGARPFEAMARRLCRHRLFDRAPLDDLALIPGTGGTTGKPKGVMLTGQNVEAMTAITLMSYPFKPSPVYLALAPLTPLPGFCAFRLWRWAAASSSCTIPTLANS